MAKQKQNLLQSDSWEASVLLPVSFYAVTNLCSTTLKLDVTYNNMLSFKNAWHWEETSTTNKKGGVNVAVKYEKWKKTV